MRDFSLKNIIRILKSLTKDEDSNSMELKSSEWRALWGMPDEQQSKERGWIRKTSDSIQTNFPNFTVGFGMGIVIIQALAVSF